MQSGEAYSNTTLFEKVCQWFMTDRLFSPGTLVSSANKTDSHDISEILLKVALNTITLIYCWLNNKCVHSVQVYNECLFIVTGSQLISSCSSHLISTQQNTLVSSKNTDSSHSLLGQNCNKLDDTWRKKKNMYVNYLYIVQNNFVCHEFLLKLTRFIRWSLKLCIIIKTIVKNVQAAR